MLNCVCFILKFNAFEVRLTLVFIKVKVNIHLLHFLFREGFNKIIKKKYGIFHTIGRTPPPPKVWNKYFFLFHIWVLKSVLMRRNFFLFFFRVPTPNSRDTSKCRGPYP